MVFAIRNVWMEQPLCIILLIVIDAVRFFYYGWRISLIYTLSHINNISEFGVEKERSDHTSHTFHILKPVRLVQSETLSTSARLLPTTHDRDSIHPKDLSHITQTHQTSPVTTTTTASCGCACLLYVLVFKLLAIYTYNIYKYIYI
jgi:hypothetical protein